MSDSNEGEPLPPPEGASDVIDTEYEVGQSNITPKIGPFGLDIHNPVLPSRGWWSWPSSS
jgi:betaine/carnitine transporter, BCCT family